MEAKRTRGLSSASKEAGAYLKRHPNASIRELAEKFKINPSTVSRAPWWKKRNQQGENN